MDHSLKQRSPVADQEAYDGNAGSSSSPNVHGSKNDTIAEAQTFLGAVWGADATVNFIATHYVCDLHARRFNHHLVSNVSKAAQQALVLSNVGIDVYFACAEFEAGKARKSENAIGAYSFWIDVDCGLAKAAEKKGYTTKEVALAAITDFCGIVALPEPSIIVCSGYGLHCYWHFDQLVTAEQWRFTANKLKQNTRRHGLLVDPSRTSDIASVLRVPGTHNWKDANNPQLVTILRFREPINFTEFNSALDEVKEDKQCKSFESNSAGAERYPPSSAKRIVQKCPTLAYVVEKGGVVSEPLWRLTIGVLKHTEEGAVYCHEISKGDPRYDYDETQGKIDLWKTPPTRCSTFREQPESQCAVCAAQCKSPIQLGYPDNADQLAVALIELNQRCFVARVGGKVYVFDQDSKEILSSGMTFEAFQQWHAGWRVTGKSVAKEWLSSPNRRNYGGLAFEPSGKAQWNYYNTWAGLAVEPMQGQCGLILNHIREVLCSGDAVQNEYVIKWMALLVQKPWIKPEVALVLKSAEGTGKTTITDLLLKFFGQHGFTTAQKEQVAGRFSGHLFNKVLVVLEEAFFAGDPAAVAAAKALVTNRNYGYESKGKDAITAQNYAHVIFLTNHDWAVPAKGDARRWMVLEVSDERNGDHEYFSELHQEIENGGAEAFLDYLLGTDLTGFNPRVFPRTGALRRQQLETLLHADPVAAWWLRFLSDGMLDVKGWETETRTFVIENSYGDATKGVRNAPPWHVAAKRWKELLPIGSGIKVRKSRNGYGREHYYVLPDLEAACRHFEQKTGVDPLDY